MKLTRLSLTLASFVLSVGLLRADLTRTEFGKKGDWTISWITDKDGLFVRSEMQRTYTAKQEVHLRISFDGENHYIDSTADWSDIPDAKSHVAEMRIDSAASEPAWQGKAKVLDDEDGMSWLRITQPGQPEDGDGLADAKKLFIYVGPVGEAVEWNFDLKQGNAAYKDMIKCYHEHAETPETEEEGKAKSDAVRKTGGGKAAGAKEAAELTEHEYTRLPEWTVHYFTDADGKYVQGSIIRFYEDTSMLRWTADATHFHLDLAGDWNQMKGAKKDKAGNISASLTSDEDPDNEDFVIVGKVIDDEGDKWLRFSQSYEEPGGMEDGVRNAKNLRIRFGDGKFWSFDLKGSHAARQKLEECEKKHGNK